MVKELRDKMLPHEIVHSNDLSQRENFLQIMSNMDMNITAKFIYNALNDRDIYLDVLHTIQGITKSVEMHTSQDKKPPSIKSVVKQSRKVNVLVKSYVIQNVSDDGLGDTHHFMVFTSNFQSRVYLSSKNAAKTGQK